MTTCITQKKNKIGLKAERVRKNYNLCTFYCRGWQVYVETLLDFRIHRAPLHPSTDSLQPNTPLSLPMTVS